MRSLLLTALMGFTSLGLVGMTPAPAKASWLSEALHARYDPYYAAPYYAPGYNYYAPTYVAPSGVYVAPTVVPYVGYSFGPRYYGRSYYGPRYYGHHEWHEGRGWHEGHGEHHYR